MGIDCRACEGSLRVRNKPMKHLAVRDYFAVELGVFLLLSSVSVFIWFGSPGNLLWGLDSYLSLTPIKHFQLNLYSWNDLLGTGSPSFSAPSLPYLALVSLLEEIGTQPRQQEMTVYFLLVFGSMVSMRQLSSLRFNGSNLEDSSARFLVSTFYTLNPLTASFVWRSQNFFQFSMVLFPLMLYE